MATIIRLNQAITDMNAPKVVEVITSHSFNGGDLSKTDTAFGGREWQMANTDNAWQPSQGGITASARGALSLSGLPEDLGIEITVRSLQDSGRLLLSLRVDTETGDNREVLEINSDGSIRFNPRVGGHQHAGAWYSAGLVKSGSKVKIAAVDNVVRAYVDGKLAIEQPTIAPIGNLLMVSTYQISSGLLIDDLIVTAA